MPTNRTRVRRAAREPLSAVQIAYLLDQPLPKEGWRPGVPSGDGWWLMCVAHAHDCYIGYEHTACVPARLLWQRYRAELLPEWRRLHGRRRHPLECGRWPARAEASARAILAQRREQREQIVVPFPEGRTGAD